MTEFYLFAVEDKVKDQLEAANPEPIIEEVVSNLLCKRDFICCCFSRCCIHVFSFLPGFGQPCPEKTRLVRPFSKVLLNLYGA